MTEKFTPTFNVDIHMAGDMREAANIIQCYAIDVGMCVSLTAQTFVYTGGREEGFKATFINYPRFPARPDDILEKARGLADHLMVRLGQQSYSIVTPDTSFWISRRPEEG